MPEFSWMHYAFLILSKMAYSSKGTIFSLLSALLRGFSYPGAFPDSGEWYFKLFVEVLPYVALGGLLVLHTGPKIDWKFSWAGSQSLLALYIQPLSSGQQEVLFV